MTTKNKNLYEAFHVKLSYVNETKTCNRPIVHNADDAAVILFDTWDKSTIEHIEEVKILLLNRAHQVLGIATISQGGLTGATIDVRLIAQSATLPGI